MYLRSTACPTPLSKATKTQQQKRCFHTEIMLRRSIHLYEMMQTACMREGLYIEHVSGILIFSLVFTQPQDGTEWGETTLTGNEKIEDTVQCVSTSGRPGHATLMVRDIRGIVLTDWGIAFRRPTTGDE